MKIPIYTVNAFSNKSFSGNPAAYCPLDKWLKDEDLQKIAEQNNLSETVFTVPMSDDHDYHIRWFTPQTEVRLCGHATLASAFVLFEKLGHTKSDIIYHSKSGRISVKAINELYQLNFPTDNLVEIDITNTMSKPFNFKPIKALRGTDDLLLIFNNEQEIKNIKPNFEQLSDLKTRGVIVSAKGSDHDFVSRCFYPAVGINEDPATGSAHTTLTPYWSNTLNKLQLKAKQLSQRGGSFYCTSMNDRTLIGGSCHLYGEGIIYI